MLTVDKSSLQIGNNDHINGTVKYRRNKLKLLYINNFDYHIHGVLHMYIC